MIYLTYLCEVCYHFHLSLTGLLNQCNRGVCVFAVNVNLTKNSWPMCILLSYFFVRHHSPCFERDFDCRLMVKEVDKRGNVRNKTVLYPLPRMTVCYVYHTTLGRFSKVDCSTTKRVPTVPTPNDTSSESSQPDVSNAELVGTDPIPAVDISTMEIRPGGCHIYRRIRSVALLYRSTCPQKKNTSNRITLRECLVLTAPKYEGPRPL